MIIRLWNPVEPQNRGTVDLHSINRMTSPESMSESVHSVGSSWNNVGQPIGLSTTDDISMVPGTMILRNQTSVLGVDFATGNMTDNLSLARPGYNNVADLATTSFRVAMGGVFLQSSILVILLLHILLIDLVQPFLLLQVFPLGPKRNSEIS